MASLNQNPWRKKFRPLLWRVAISCLLLVGLVAAAAVPAAAAVAAAAPDEYQIKAVFLFNFARFVDWPADTFATAETPVTIGVLGDDPFGGFLDEAVRGEKVHERSIAVRRFRRVDDVQNCHILFISESETSRLHSILNRLKGRRILTVGDAENFAATGGMIGFINTNGRIRLQINVGCARAEDLVISSKLLRPSEIIGPDKSERPTRFPETGPAFANFGLSDALALAVLTESSRATVN